MRFWLVTCGAQGTEQVQDAGLGQTVLWGFGRTMALEHPDWEVHVLDLDPQAAVETQQQSLWDELTCGDSSQEQEVMLRGDQRLVRRLQRGMDDQVTESQRTRLCVRSRGTLDGLALEQVQRRAPSESEVEVAVMASGLNFRDVLNVLGQYPGQPPLGAECSGVVTRRGARVQGLSVGDRVVVVAADTFCDFLCVPAQRVVPIPAQLSFADAATIPVAFMTALVALQEAGRLQHGERVLIHAATGGVGLAALQLARSEGAEVFATASEAKHHRLRELGVRHIYDSRQPGFADQILQDTAGRGVDVVLNSLGPELIGDNVRALAPHGRYIDITKTPDVETHPQFAARRGELEYTLIDLAQQLVEPERVQQLLPDLVRRVSDGELTALPSRQFDLQDAKEAFRFMRSARHIGKILLCPQHHPGVTAAATCGTQDATAGTSTVEAPSLVQPIRSDRSYWVTGGLGGLGLALAQWLAEQGAGHIGLLARSAPTDAQQAAVDRLHAQGVQLYVHRVDVEDPAVLREVHAWYAQHAAPLGGVFHLAGRLDDSLILRQTRQQFANVLGPKVRGAWNLHQLTADDPLDHFVLFSSVSSVFGSTGQANHAAANAFLDGLAHYRRAQGRPALSINWGPWSEIGAAAARDVQSRNDLAGIGMLNPREGMQLFATALTSGRPQITAVQLDIARLPARWRQRPLFADLQRSQPGQSMSARSDTAFLREFRHAPDQTRRSLLLSHLQDLVAATLGMDSARSVAPDQALSDMGLDSLASLELGNNLEESLQVSVPSTLVYDYPTLETMAEYFLERIPLADPAELDDRAVSHAPAQPGRSLADQRRYDSHQVEEPARASSPKEDHQDSDDVLQNIQELSDELDLWDEV